MALAQAFIVDLEQSMTRIEIENGRTFEYDPPVLLEAGVKYSFNVETGELFRHADDLMESIAKSHCS